MSVPNEKKWDAFVTKYGPDPEKLWKHKKTVKFIAREGIPNKYRRDLWFAFSGACQKRAQGTADGQGYGSVLKDCKGADNTSTEQIEKDLHRTGLKGFQENPELIDKLRRVLTAFAHRHPEVGYCQAMNFIGGALLLNMPDSETNCFWTLAAIIEDIMPRTYYDDSMRALHVDIRVFQDLVKEKLPKMHAHIVSLDIILQPISTIWFLSLFVHAVPDEAVCRIWDSLLIEGSKMLFRVGLGLMKIKQKEFLETDSFEDGYQCLMEPPTDYAAACDVMRVAFDKKWIGKFSMDRIKELRHLHTAAVEKELAAVEARSAERQRLAQDRAIQRKKDEAAEAAAEAAAPESGDGGQSATAEGDAGGDGGVGGDDSGGVTGVQGVASPPPPDDKYSKVFSELSNTGVNSGRRKSLALMMSYTSGGDDHAAAMAAASDMHARMTAMGTVAETFGDVGDGDDWNNDNDDEDEDDDETVGSLRSSTLSPMPSGNSDGAGGSVEQKMGDASLS